MNLPDDVLKEAAKNVYFPDHDPRREMRPEHRLIAGLFALDRHKYSEYADFEAEFVARAHHALGHYDPLAGGVADVPEDNPEGPQQENVTEGHPFTLDPHWVVTTTQLPDFDLGQGLFAPDMYVGESQQVKFSHRATVGTSESKTKFHGPVDMLLPVLDKIMGGAA
jgi:hypothetical protein